MPNSVDTHQRLHDLLKDFDTAMLVTGSLDGGLRGRPMAVAELALAKLMERHICATVFLSTHRRPIRSKAFAAPAPSAQAAPKSLVLPKSKTSNAADFSHRPRIASLTVLRSVITQLSNA